MKNITLRDLKAMEACNKAIEWFKTQNDVSVPGLVNALVAYDENEKYAWANRLLLKVLNKQNRVQYTLFAAEPVLYALEREYPGDQRPRKAIEAAKVYVNNPTEENRLSTLSAAKAVYSPNNDDFYIAIDDYYDDSNVVYYAVTSAFYKSHLTTNKAELSVFWKEVTAYGLSLFKDQKVRNDAY